MKSDADVAAAAREQTIVLIGLRGSGKTSVGRSIAARLGRGFVDLDERIEQRAGATIAEIFAARGEAQFREMEYQALSDELRSLARPAVLSVGGGAVLREDSRELLRACRCVWLTASPDVLARRIEADATSNDRRPALTNLSSHDELVKLLRERDSMYRELAVFEVDTTNRTLAEVADAVVARLSEHLSAARKIQP